MPKALPAEVKKHYATAPSVGAEILALYEKIREANNGIGAAALAGNQCKGCNLTLNTIELQRISGYRGSNAGR